MDFRVLQVLVLVLLAASGVLIDRDPRELTCSEGLTDCNVSSVFMHGVAPEDSVDVTQLRLSFVLRCPAGRKCEPSLRTSITVRELENTPDVSEESGGDDEGQRSGGSGDSAPSELRVKVCRSSPGAGEWCRILGFKPSDSGSRRPRTHLLHLTETVSLGDPVVVHTSSRRTSLVRNVTIPSLEKVCTKNLQVVVEGCEVPRIHVVMDPQRNVARLQVENMANSNKELLYLMVWNEIPGNVSKWPEEESEIVISLDLVAPCLCFQAWWKGQGIRSQLCPFKKLQGALERMQSKVSVSVVEAQVLNGDMILIWNVSAPCRLEAELWLCKKDLSGGGCEEVAGSKRKLDNREHWGATRSGHWTSGTFNASSHPQLCVQLKVSGMQSYMEPLCPFEAPRWRWSLLILAGLFLICLVGLAAYFIRVILKDYVCRWLKDNDVKGAVGGCHVILLYPTANDQTLCELVCHLGSSLQTLGFSVSLDLWCRRELSELGPVPWLHSRLDRLRRQGGKVVVVLSKAAWARAEEWGAGSWEKNTPKEIRSSSDRVDSPDVFSASLSCILADYLQGRAGERFMLVQFESLPVEPPGGCKMVPELFRGLHVYSLPSQSLGFLTELAGARQTSTGTTRRRRAGGIRRASQALARGLLGFTAGGPVLQTCVGVEMEDVGESVPLQPGPVSTSFVPEPHL